VLRNLTLLSFKGISVKLHWTFILFIVWLAVTNPGNVGDKAAEVLFILGIFTCVVLHEYGHALTARSFGIRTRDITLYPIGGVAVLEKEPRPAQEFFIALAGPLVNVVIATFLANLYDLNNLEELNFEDDFGARLLVANIVLVMFNMIPAYPMDGGRVLRAALGCFLNQSTATIISGRIGQIFSIIMAGIALYFGHTILLLISIFIFLQARREIQFWNRQREDLVIVLPSDNSRTE
jgi:stage IV sporulation protein FB